MRAFLVQSAFLTISMLTLGCAADSRDWDSHSSAIGRGADCDHDAGPCGERPDDVPRGERPDGGPAVGCAFGQGFWKNHEDWPVAELTLGSTMYTQEQLLEILRTPVEGNGLISIAHHLIAAKLNVANGVDDEDLLAAIDEADALIGDLVVPPVGDGNVHPKLLDRLNGRLATDPTGCKE